MNDPIVCLPTRWFYQRALGMLAIFLFLGGWFLKDASTGYRQKNLEYVMHRSFASAAQLLQDKQQAEIMSEEAWRAFATAQCVDVGNDIALLPTRTPNPLPWPEELLDLALLTKGQSSAWEAFTGRMKWNRKPPKKFHDAASIREQWYMAYALGGLALYTAFIALRTSRRRLSINDECIITQEGRSIRLSDLIRLDLRKWATKGLAFAYYQKSDGKEGVIRIDGLTYGGFQKEHGEPAERLMQLLREHFSGELIEYASESDPAPEKEV
jgi:hypothetical protein